LLFMLWLCWSLVSDPVELRKVLESTRALAAAAEGAAKASHGFVWVVLHLLEGSPEEARGEALRLLAQPSLTARGFRGRLHAVVAACTSLIDGDPGPHLDEARRLLLGTTYDDYLTWADEVVADRQLVPARLPFASDRVVVARHGGWFSVGGRRTDLSDSPLAQALLAQLADGPRTSDQLIDAVWPGDASSYGSLKNRLHALVRVLRRKGLQRALVYRRGTYVLEGIALG